MGKIALAGLLLALGFALGRSVGSGDLPEEDPAPTARAHLRPDRPPLARALPRGVVGDFFSGDSKSEGDAVTLARRVGVEGFSGFLEELLAERRASGLGYQEQKRLSAMLESLWEQDPGGTLKALDSIGNTDVRGRLLAGLIDGLVERDSLDPAEIPELAECLFASAGLGGLGHGGKRALEAMIGRWYERSPGEVRAWVLGIGNEGERTVCLAKLIEVEAAGDLDVALELAESQFRGSSAARDLPMNLFQEAVGQGSDTLLRAIGASAYPGKSASGQEIEYPEGFDFAATLERLTEAERDLPEGWRYAHYPSNLLSEWAKVDPQAAFDWMSGGSKVSFNSEIGDFLKGYATVARPDEWSPLLVPMLTGDVSHIRDSAYQASFEQLRGQGPAGVEEWLAGLEGSVPRDVALSGLLHGVAFWGGNGIQDQRAVILAQMSPAVRLDVEQAWAGRWLRDERMRTEYRQALSRLGHSEAEIDAALARVPER